MKLKTLRNDSGQLSIQLLPTGEWLLVALGALLMLLGPILVYLLGWVVTIEMRDGTLEHQQSLLGLVWQETTSIPVSDIDLFQTEIRRSALAATMAVVVKSKIGQVQDLRVGDMAGEDKEKLVAQLNSSLVSGVAFRHASDQGAAIAGSLIFGGSMFALGLFCLNYLQTVWISGELSTGKICVRRRRRLFRWRTAEDQCIAISDFSHVASSECSVTTAGGPSASSQFVWLETKDGQSIPLAHGPMFTEASSQQLAQAITGWIQASQEGILASDISKG